MAVATPVVAGSANWPSAPDPPTRRRRQAPTELEDALVARARTDRAAFGELYELHRGHVLAFVRSRLRHASDAEDVTQEVFLRALGAIGRYELRGWPFRAWLFQIAANAVADHHSRGRRHGGGLDDVPHGLLAGGSWPDEVVADIDAVRRSWTAIDALPARQRTALALQVAADLPLDEVGARMGTSTGAVKLLLHRARHGVRRRLAAAEAAR
jgi:RNA polymerase sigma-70 factor, ECF subfamily